VIVVCFSAFVVALGHGHEWGYASFRTGVFLTAAAVSAFWLIRIETRTASPIFDPGLLKIRLFILPIVSAMILFAGLFFIVFLMPFFLVHPSGRSVDQAAYMMVIPFVFLFFVSPLSGALSDRMGSRLLCTLGMGVLAAALFSLALLSPTAPFFSVAWRLALAGIGTAIFISPNSAVAMGAAPVHRRGVAAGTVATARNFGMMMGVALAGLIFNSVFAAFSGEPGLRNYRPELESSFMAAFHHAMAAGGIVVLMGVGVAFFRGPEGRNRSVSEDGGGH
jgi:MFS family permease